MAKSVDASRMRQLNKKYVTEIIYNNGPVSRIQISHLTGLNKATVSSLVDEIIVEKFAVEIGYGASRGGRKPMLLKFNSQSGYCIGVDVQITHVTTILADMMGKIVYKRICPVTFSNEELRTKQLEKVLITEMNQAVNHAPPSVHGIIGAGIALPGLVNFKTGKAFYLPNIEVRDWDIINGLSPNFSFPLFIDNDGNCGAWSEYRTRQLKNLVFVNAGVGIGAGLVIDGTLYRGSNGLAGEYGHTSISATGLLCACGSYGCWEQYGSEQALVRYLHFTKEKTPLELSPDFVKLVVECARINPEYKRALIEIGHYLGIGISNIANSLNPDIVILGGTIAQGKEFILPELKLVVKHRSLLSNKNLVIDFAQDDAVVIGAAFLPIFNIIFSE